MLWTVAVNHYEFCEGVFNTEEAAEKHAVALVKDDCPEAEDFTDEQALEYVDGYYSVMRINKVR